EGTSPENTAIAGEADLLKGTAEYDLATGKVTFGLTTRVAQESTPEEKRPLAQYTAALISPKNFSCSKEGVEEATKEAGEGSGPSAFPVLEVLSANFPFPSPPPGQPLAGAYGRVFKTQEELEKSNGEGFQAGSKTVDGTTATVSVTLPEA